MTEPFTLPEALAKVEKERQYALAKAIEYIGAQRKEWLLAADEFVRLAVTLRQMGETREPGTPAARLTAFLDELEWRFPSAHLRFRSDPPELAYLKAIDRMRAAPVAETPKPPEDRCDACGGPRFRCECCTTAGFDRPKPVPPVSALPTQQEVLAVCGLCGEPMPPGEEMFKFHGYSGDCPKPIHQKSSETHPAKIDFLLDTIRDHAGFIGDEDVRTDFRKAVDDLRSALSRPPREPSGAPDLETVRRIMDLARWESGAMGEDGWWFDTPEKLLAALKSGATPPPGGTP